MSDRIQEKMDRIRARQESRIQEVREDIDLNEDAKRRRIKEIHDEATTKHSELFEQRRAEITGTLEKKRKAALGPPEIFNADKASLSMSYRDALDRVSGIDTGERLQEVLERANLTGDRVLAKAALYRGYELESEEAVGAYLEAFPDDRKTWDEFMGAAQEHNALEKQERMFGTLGPDKPRELGGVG